MATNHSDEIKHLQQKREEMLKKIEYLENVFKEEKNNEECWWGHAGTRYQTANIDLQVLTDHLNSVEERIRQLSAQAHKTPPFKKIKLFFATTNKTKWEYLAVWCEQLDYKRLTPLDIDKSLWPKFEENGKTLEDNAIIKAKNWSNVVKDVFVIGHDCGVKIPALRNKWNEAMTKRQVGGDATDNIGKIKQLLVMMKNLKGEERLIQWSDAVAVALNGKILGSKTLPCPVGYVVEKLPENPKIMAGAPLATIEYKPDFGKVYSELSEEEIREHDAKTIKKVQTLLKRLINSAQP